MRDKEIKKDDDLLLDGMYIQILLNFIKVNRSMNFNQANKTREIVALAAEKLKLHQLNGILISRSKVEKALFTVGNEPKESLRNMPQKIVRMIMDAMTEAEGITILTDGLTEILSDYEV